MTGRTRAAWWAAWLLIAGALLAAGLISRAVVAEEPGETPASSTRQGEGLVRGGSDVVAPGHTYQGFGAHTAGGRGRPRYWVTNLGDSGPGSLRDALSQGNRHVVFGVGGVIETVRRLHVRGSNITIDGFTAPPPGITIKNRGLDIFADRGAHDVVVRGIQVQIVDDRPGKEDGISVGTFNVVIDHVSVRGASDENIGINNARDVTVSWSILAEPREFHATNMLITNRSQRISVHHNLFIKSARRNPWIATEAPEIQADVRNNVMWDVSGGSTNHGTLVYAGAKANIVNNYYRAATGVAEGGQKRVITICRGWGVAMEDLEFCVGHLRMFPAARAYIAGNVSAEGWTDHINAKGTESGPFPAAPVETTDACTAARLVISQAGVRPLDPVYREYLRPISVVGC